MIFKYLQILYKISQAGSRGFEPRLPLNMENPENKSLTLIITVY